MFGGKGLFGDKKEKEKIKIEPIASPDSPDSPGDYHSSNESVPGAQSGHLAPGKIYPDLKSQKMIQLQELWNELKGSDKSSFLERNKIPTAPPLSYQTELEQELTDLEEDEQVINEELDELRDLKEVDDDQYGALAERRNHSEKTLKLLEEKSNLIKVARKKQENALNIERQLRLKELREGRLKNTSQDDLADIIGGLVRKEVAKLALNAKASKMRENLQEDEEEIYQNIPRRKKSEKNEPIYAKLLKPKIGLSSMTKEERSALNINDNLMGLDSDHDFNRKDDFPSLQTKEKKRVMIAADNDSTPERDTKFHPPDQGDNQSLISFGGSSVFDQNPVSYLIYKLNKIHKKAENVIFQHSSEQKLLEMISKELTSSLEKYEEEGRKLKSVSPTEQEEIEQLLKNLEEDQFKAVLSLSKISQKNENKKNAARPSFPVFDGSPLSFLNWQHEIDCAMEHLEDPQKRSTYKKCISGVNKDFILTHLTNCTTYDKMKSAMFNMFGHVDSLLPKLISEMRDLPSTPSNSFDENKNINEILAFMRWLESHNKESVFSSDLIISARKKLRQFTQDLYYQHRCRTFTDFKLYLENLQENNFERLQSEEGKKGLPGVGAKVAGFQPRRPCLLCSQDHRESNCHMIKSLTSDSQVKDLLRKNNLCFICLEKFGKNHNCSKTWRNKAGHIQQKSCQKCKNGLNYFVCPHVRGPRQNTPVTGQGSGAGASGGQSSVAGASGGQGSLPSASSGTQVYSNAKACSMDQNIVKVFFTKIIVNGTQFGKTQCCSQIVKVVSRNGAVVDIHVLWDRGAEHSVCSLELQEFFWDAPPLNFSLSQVSTCQEVRGKLATLRLLTNDGNTLNIQALAQPLTARHVESKCLPVPQTWQKLHSLPENYTGPSGAYTLILGQDVNDIFPIEIDRYDKLSALSTQSFG